MGKCLPQTIKPEKKRYISVLRKIVLISIALLSFQGAKAQYDASFAHYFDLEPSFNPAAAGKEAKLNIAAAYALDMAGFKNNPQTAYAAADMPFYALRRLHGVGVRLMNDKIGLFTHQQLALQYAFRTALFGGRLGIGAQVGLLSENMNGSKTNLEDSSDPAFSTTDVKGSGIDLAFGLYYDHSDWYAGISGQHLTAPTITLGETNELKIDPTLYFTVGYNIKLRNPFLKVKTSTLVRTDLTAYRADITARLEYNHEKRMLYGGIGYSPTRSVTAFIGGKFQGVVLGYSYEMYTSALAPGNGSHELFVGYQVDINLQKKGRNRHTSVRIL